MIFFTNLCNVLKIMKIAWIRILVLFLLQICSFSQNNLVFNSGFENHSNCPNFDQINFSSGWFSAANTPDYLNACSSPTSVGIPKNRFGSQYALNGGSYAGFYAYTFSNYREYIETQLLQPLIKNTRYYVSMKVSLGEYWSGEWDFDTLYPAYLPCNKIGMKFSTKTQIIGANNTLMNNHAQFYTQALISDTTNWTTVQGSFVADSSYTHLIIGNFFDGFNTNIINRPGGKAAYFYVDDVIVSSDSTVIDYTLDVTETYNQKIVKSLFPNPVRGKLRLDIQLADLKDSKIEIVNALGQIVSVFYDLQDEMDVSQLPIGVYFIKVRQRGRTEILKFLKE